MKCSACQMEISEDIKAHYASNIHKINTRRQIYNAPPITIEEIDADQPSDDISIEVDGQEHECGSRGIQRQRSLSAARSCIAETCLFCESPENSNHYLEHGLSDEDVAYIQNKVCYVCYEGFSRREHLKTHIVTGRHRNVLTDGVNLILESGKVIQGRGRPKRENVVQRLEKERGTMLMQIVTREEKRTIAQNKNKLKVSLGMNHQMTYKPDWMQ